MDEEKLLKCAVPEHPLILFVDGHKSHVTLEVIDLAHVIFPHIQHMLCSQLDVAVFKSLKDYFSRAVRAKKILLCLREISLVLLKNLLNMPFLFPTSRQDL